TSSARRATSTPTRTGSSWRSACTGSTKRVEPSSCRPTSTCCRVAARRRPRSWAGWWASTSRIPGSGTAVSPSSRSSSSQPRRRQRSPAGYSGSQPPQLAAELVEPHRTELEHARVERLEVEARAGAPTDVVAALEPHAFADLVGDRLSRPAEVAVDLARHELLVEEAALDHEGQREVGRPPLAGVVPLARWDRQLEMKADVDHDP